MTEVIHDVANDPTMKVFWCPGCECGHFLTTDRWTWNGDRVAPTVTPSILVRYNGPDAGVNGAPQRACHFFITAGHLNYGTDCSHRFAGQSVPMEQWP